MSPASVITLPVYLRIGDTPEAEIATVDLPTHGPEQLTATRQAIADMLRAAADAFEQPDAQEVPDAAS